jgi:hypothetical protein
MLPAPLGISIFCVQPENLASADYGLPSRPVPAILSTRFCAREFEHDLQLKPDFDITIETAEETAGPQPTRNPEKHHICGEDWAKAVTSPRRC